MSSPFFVKPSEIQRELDRLEEAHKENKQQRACLFNLVVYAFQSDRLPFFSELIDQIAKQFPCRILFIQEGPDEKCSELKTSILVKVLQEGANKSILCEQINVELPESLNEKVYSLLLPHFVPDLPIHLIWAKDPTKPHPLFEPFKKLADRIIFESECSDHLQPFASEVQNRLLNGLWDVIDLNWVRLESWRKVIKSLFNSEARLEELKGASRIKLRYQGEASAYFCHNHFQVHYLHTWLAAQLDWVFDSFESKDHGKKIAYKKPGQKGVCLVEIQKEDQKISKDPGQVTYLEVLSPLKNKFVCSLKPDEPLIEVHISNEEKPKETYNSYSMQIKWQQSLAQEICYQKTSQHYCNMLGILASIKGLV